MKKCAKFHKDSPSGKKLNSITQPLLNFRRRPILCTTLNRNLMQASNFGDTFDQLSPSSFFMHFSQNSKMPLYFSIPDTAISALIFEGKFPILEARFISEQSRPSVRPGRENGCACRSVQRPSDQASLCSTPGSLSGLASPFFFFGCNETVQKCLSESVLCLQKCALRFFYMHGMCWLIGNVCEAKKQLTRVCSGDRHLSLHLTFTRAIASSPVAVFV